MKVNFSEMPDG